ncbi:sodium/proline symporter [Endothiovibrio diazotrophicus]
MLVSFLAFLLLFVVIGLSAVRKSRRESLDYLLAGQSVRPWLVALSAVATNNSGYMFIGMVGYTYAAGLSAIWMAVGWILGDFVASLLVHRKVREMSERNGVHTFGGLLSHWHDANHAWLRRLAGVFTLLFLGTYAAAQLTAGSKALGVLFGWPQWAGAVIGAVIVLAYSFAGGIRASIWTDAAQAVVMILAMGLMMWIGVDQLGGWGGFTAALHGVGPHYMDWFPGDFAWGPWLGGAGFLLGWLVAGYGVVGQPHIMIRFMAMESPDQMRAVRIYYYGWFTLFWTLGILTALAARVLLPESSQFDAELALPTLARELLPGVLVGLVLAGIFAATISTADSLILSCAASLTRDFHHQKVDHYLVTKFGTVAVTAMALAIALSDNHSVFDLVMDAWGVLAAAFGPLLTLLALGRRPSERVSIATLVLGAATFYLWSLYGPGDLYAVAPAFLLPLAFGWAFTPVRPAVNGI